MLNDLDSSEDIGLRTDFWYNPKQLQVGKLATHHIMHHVLLKKNTYIHTQTHP